MIASGIAGLKVAHDGVKGFTAAGDTRSLASAGRSVSYTSRIC